MKILKILHDDYGNTAKIRKTKIYPFEESQIKEDSYILTLTSDYNGDLIYFVSVYESEKEAIKKLKELSCGTFK